MPPPRPSARGRRQMFDDDEYFYGGEVYGGASNQVLDDTEFGTASNRAGLPLGSWRETHALHHVQVRVKTHDPLSNLAGLGDDDNNQEDSEGVAIPESDPVAAPSTGDENTDEPIETPKASNPSASAAAAPATRAGVKSLETQPLDGNVTESLLSRLQSSESSKRADKSDNNADNNDNHHHTSVWPPRDLDAGTKLMRDKSLKPPVHRERQVAWPPSGDGHADWSETVEARLAARKRVQGQAELDPQAGKTEADVDKTPIESLLSIVSIRPIPDSERIYSQTEIVIQFDHDVVPLADHSTLIWNTDDKLKKKQAAYFPAALDPCPKGGRWFWRASDLLVFDMSNIGEGSALPHSTLYTLKIKAASSVDSKRIMSSDQTHTFSTGLPYMVSNSPYSYTNELRPLCQIDFDQLVNPLATLKDVQFTHFGGFRTAAAPILTDSLGNVATDLVKEQSSRRVYFIPDRDLPLNSNIRVEVGIPVSAEGPDRGTKKVGHFSFSSRQPMRVSSLSPDYTIYPQDSRDCSCSFSNDVDWTVTPKDCLRIRPQPMQFEIVSQVGSRIEWRQEAAAGVTYHVSFDGIVDVFGQPLSGWRQSRKISVGKEPSYKPGPVPQRLRHGDYFDWDSKIMLDQQAVKLEGPRFSFVASQFSELRVCLYKLPGPRGHNLRASTYHGIDDRKKCPLGEQKWGKYKVFDQALPIEVLRAMTRSKDPSAASSPVSEGEEEIDLDLSQLVAGVNLKTEKERVKRSTSSKAVADVMDEADPENTLLDYGHYFLYIEPTKKSIRKSWSFNPFDKSWWHYRDHIEANIVHTRLNVQSCKSPHGVCLLVTDLLTGEPVKGANFWAFVASDSFEPGDQCDLKQLTEFPSGDSEQAKDYRRCRVGRTDKHGCCVVPVQAFRAAFIVAKQLSSYSYLNPALVCEHESDAIYIPSTFPSASDDRVMFFVHDDRKMYKPKETVHIKGFVRELSRRGPQIPDAFVSDDIKAARNYLDSLNTDADAFKFHADEMGPQVKIPQNVSSSGQVVHVRVRDVRGELIFGADNPVKVPISSEFGSFDFSFDFPDAANLGQATVEIAFGTNTHYHSVDVQEFRTPEYKSSTSVESEAPFLAKPLSRLERLEFVAKNFDQEKDIVTFARDKLFADVLLDDVQFSEDSPARPREEEKAIVATRATYYSGGALSEARVEWNVQHGKTSFSPAGGMWSDFTFSSKEFTLGHPSNDHWFGRRRGRGPVPSSNDPTWRVKVGWNDNRQGDAASFMTDSSGKHTVELDWRWLYWPPCPVSVTAEATVLDSNNQNTVSRANFVVHASSQYCGLFVGLREDEVDIDSSRGRREAPRQQYDWSKIQESKPRVGEVIPVWICVVDLEGNAIPGASVDLRIVGSGTNPTTRKHEVVNDLVEISTRTSHGVEQLEVIDLSADPALATINDGNDLPTVVPADYVSASESPFPMPERATTILSVSVESGVALFPLRPRTSGSYTLTSLVTDAQGRVHASSATFYVEDRPSAATKARRDDQKSKKVSTNMTFATIDKVVLEVDHKEKPYAPGEECLITVAPPSVPCAGTLFASVGDETHRSHFQITEQDKLIDGRSGIVIPLQIFAEFEPQVSLRCVCSGLQRTRKGTATPAPMNATGELNVLVAADARKLFVKVEPSVSKAFPGDAVEVVVSIESADYETEQSFSTHLQKTGEVLLFAVDSSILDLSGFVPPNPLQAMLPEASDNSSLDTLSYNRLLLRDLQYLRDRALEEESSSEDRKDDYNDVDDSSSDDDDDSDNDFRAKPAALDAANIEEGNRELEPASRKQQQGSFFAAPSLSSSLSRAPGGAPVSQRRSEKEMDMKKVSKARSGAASPKRKAKFSRNKDMAGGGGASYASEALAWNDDMEEASTPIITRSDFNPLAYFGTSTFQFEEGKIGGYHGSTKITVPTRDTLTTYRLFAVVSCQGFVGVSRVIDNSIIASSSGNASSRSGSSSLGSFWGTGEASVVCALPLMIRATAPRFLNFGDQLATVVISIQNQSDDDLDDIKVAARVAGAALIHEDGSVVNKLGLRTSVKAGSRGHLTLRVNPAEPPCEMVLEAAISCGKFADSVLVRVPVYLPGTSEAFATSGVLDEDGDVVVMPVLPPANAHATFGQLDVTCYSTVLDTLTDAMVYLYHYPFECNEQIASRLIGLLSLRDVLYAFNPSAGDSDQGIESALPPAWQKPRLPNKIALNVMVGADVLRLEKRQHSNGSWGFWGAANERDNPFLTAHVAHALALLREKGYSVPVSCWKDSFNYLWHIDRHIFLKITWSSSSRFAMRAFAMYVCHKMLVADKTPDTDDRWVQLHQRARSLYKGNKKVMDVETLAWIWKVLGAASPASKRDAKYDATRDEIRDIFMQRAHSTSDSATFRISGLDIGDSDAEQVILRSDVRCDAAILEALIVVDPKNKLVPKLAKSIGERRKIVRAGHYCCSAWGNTQDNAWVLLALDAYFNKFEADEPDFKACTWFGGEFAGALQFRGRTSDHLNVPIPMAHVMKLLANSARDKQSLDSDASAGEHAQMESLDSLILLKDGAPGRLYYRLSMTYAPKDLSFDHANFGMQVRRIYSHIDFEDDVKMVATCDDPATDRTTAGRQARAVLAAAGVPTEKRRKWLIKQGARVRVTLTLVNKYDNYHVALVDKLPAGFEPLNPALAAQTGMDHERDTAATNSTSWWGYSRWFEHQQLRDERVEAFTELLWPGTHTFQYICRATAAGTFIVPPATAEEMYSPDVSGRCATEYVDIVPS